MPESERKGLKPASAWGVHAVVHAAPCRPPRVPLPPSLPEDRPPRHADTPGRAGLSTRLPLGCLPCWTLSDATVFSSELRGAHSHFPKPPAQCFSGADHSSRSPQPFQLGSRNPLNPDLSRCAHVCRPARAWPCGREIQEGTKKQSRQWD